VLEPLVALADRTPLVIIPGITGSKLRDRDSGEIAWGSARGFFFPHDGGHALARPIPSGTADALEAAGPILRVELLGIWKIDVYASLARLLEANGYRLGRLDDPRPDDTFFFFSYDWRQSNVSAVRALADQLENLRRVRGEDTLRVDLLCQSNAARIARYFLKYGPASLDEAERAAARRPPEIEVDKLILLGTANGGGLRTLRDLNRGRKYVALVGRKLQPETIFTMWSVYEALPFYGSGWFIDAAGRPVDADLGDAHDWRRFGWSIYGHAAAKRLRQARRADLFGDEVQRFEFLSEALARAGRLHRALVADVADPADTRYYSIQSKSQPTPERARLRRRGDRWRTDFTADRRGPAVHVPGDGHATLASQSWLSPQELDAFAREPAYVDAEHRKIVLSREAHLRILEFLLDPDGERSLTSSTGR
jgi:hypothetical protein